MPQRVIAAHADWSVDPRKRWITIAARDGSGWRATAPRPVGDPAARLDALLSGGAAVALGLDLPLGLPRELAAGRTEAGFKPFLRGLAATPEFFGVSRHLGTVSAATPFYPARGMRGMTRAAHAAALGMSGPAGLSRWCDRATAERPAGAPLLWTLGANQTGKAAISAWRDWLVPALARAEPIDIWPFDGPLHALLAPRRAVLAEVYPAEAMRHCGLRLQGSKRDQGARRRLGPPLHAACASRAVLADADLADAITDGFGADTAGEDRFDSVVGLLGLVAVLDGSRPDFVPDDEWVRRWEGWVLGQTALPKLAGAAAVGTETGTLPPPAARC